MKMTEVGWIPKDWEVKKVSDVATMPTATISSNSFDHKYYVGTDNMLSDKAGITLFEGTLNYNSVRQYKVGDTLISNIRPYLKKVWYADKNAGCSTDVIVFRAIENEVTPEYLHIALADDRYFKCVMDAPVGTKMPRGDKKVISDFCFALPTSPSEQRRIASVLSDTDSLIASLSRTIEKKRLVKQGAMQQLLTGKTRLKGFSGEWVEKELGEIGQLTGAGVDKTIKDDETPVRLLNFLDVYNRDRIYSRELKMWVTASEMKIQKCDIRCGDIFLTPSSELPNDIGRSAVAMQDIQDACYSYHILRLRPYEKLDLNYSAYMLKTAEFEQQIRFLSEGSGKRYVISLKNFREIRIQIPSDIREQEAIGLRIATMDNEIASLEAELQKYKALKQGMMQKLLTGQIRLV